MEIPADIRGLIDSLVRRITALEDRVCVLQRENTSLRQENALLRAANATLSRENAELRQENADLRRRLYLNSDNSRKPPSSDGLKKKPRIAGSLRETSQKKSGGQAGHKGGTLERSASPDRTARHTASHCAHCRAQLTESMATGIESRQVFDMRAPRLDVTEHQAQIYTCAQCAHTTKAAFPDGVSSPVQYGPRIKAAAIYLNAQHLIPEDRTSEIMSDLFGAPLLCPASIATWSAALAERFQPVVDHIAAQLDRAPVRHLDETGFRIDGKGKWLHTVSTIALTHYTVTEKRSEIPTTLVGGIVVHDHFKSYCRVPDVVHAYCNAHHLRELKALIDIEKEPWAKKMFRLLMRANKAVNRAIQQGKTALAEYQLRRIRRLYDAIIAKGLAFHERMPALLKKPAARGRAPRRIGHNLLIRLHDFKDDVLRFAADFTVPFTNNQAERDIRMMKVKMKISGGFRTWEAAKIFVKIRSVLSTARKQGWNILRTLMATPEELIGKLNAA